MAAQLPASCLAFRKFEKSEGWPRAWPCWGVRRWARGREEVPSPHVSSCLQGLNALPGVSEGQALRVPVKALTGPCLSLSTFPTTLCGESVVSPQTDSALVGPPKRA